MLKLPQVSLVMQETRDHALALLTVQDCLEKIEFGDVLIFTDRPTEFSSLTFHCKPRIIAVEDWSSKLDWCRFSWFGVPPHVRTSHMLLCQWDAGIWDVDIWRDEFLGYDFIGSPWWYKDGKNVGNSGFCLKSTRLARYIYNRGGQYPCDSDTEDDLLCRKYRPQLEDRGGFLWAPERVAYDFAYEGCGPDVKPPTRHFGFHAAFNMGHVFDEERLLERTRLMVASPYIRESYMMRAFRERNPNIIARLQEELRAAE
jgi:hypothetical protein